MNEIVEKPKHYNQGKIEVLEFITDKLSESYSLGQVVKYVSRAGKKDDRLQDLKKAKFYLDWEIMQEKAKREGKEPCKPNELYGTSSTVEGES